MSCACGNNKCGIRQYLPPEPYFPPSPTPPCSKTDVGKCLFENPQIFIVDTESEIRVTCKSSNTAKGRVDLVDVFQHLRLQECTTDCVKGLFLQVRYSAYLGIHPEVALWSEQDLDIQELTV